MTDRLEFGNLKLEMVQEYSPGIGSINKAYILYDGNTAIATIPKLMRRPKLRGVCIENDIIKIANEIGNKQTLWVRTGTNNFEFLNSAIISVDLDYWKYAEGKNYYKFTLSFAVEGGA